MRSVPILTLSSGLPFVLVEELLTQVEAVLERHGAERLWIDEASCELTVVAELPDRRDAGVGPVG